MQILKGKYMRNILMSICASVAFGCSSIYTYPYPATGNAGIDTALASSDYTHDQKLEMIRKHKARASGTTSLPKYDPVVDMSTCANCNYQQDLNQCRSIAANNTNYAGNTITSAAAGAGIGAVIGAVMGVDFGSVAIAGAAGGAIGGLGNEHLTVNSMIARCMQGRGYSVLR